MNTAHIWKKGATRFSAFLVFLSLWMMVPASWAAYEVNTGDIKANALTSTPTQWTEDLTVEWKAPSATAPDVLMGYLYKWNQSVSSLNTSDILYTEFSAAVDGTVDPQLDPPQVVKAKADLAALDSGDVLYLHIMTWYTAATGVRVSADVVYGPFMIDNTAPTGTVRIVDSVENDIASTSDTRLNLKFTAAKEPAKMYLSETSTKPATGVTYSADLVWDLIDTTPGTKEIYAWFEDSLGNTSAAPATDSVTLLAATSISPNTATIDLAGTVTQTFRVEGTAAVHNWSIVNAVPDTTGATVAEITGSPSGNSVTVTGLAKGTFQLQADPDTTPGNGNELTSGTITVAQTIMPGDVNGNGIIDFDDVRDAYLFFLELEVPTSQQIVTANLSDDGDGGNIISYNDVRELYLLFLFSE